MLRYRYTVLCVRLSMMFQWLAFAVLPKGRN